MSKYITDLEVSLNETEENQLSLGGFTKIDVDLNKGIGGKHIYVWYKRGGYRPITRIQFSFTDDMTKGLSDAGYTKIYKNLNAGPGGTPVYLWFFQGSSMYDVPIEKLEASTDDNAQKFRDGLQRLACDLNREAGGRWVYLWVERDQPTYICDIEATANNQGDGNNFKNGYIRVDEDTNRGAGGAYVFIFYSHTAKSEGAIKDLQASINDDQYKKFKEDGYELVNVNLNQDTEGPPVYLWYKKDGKGPIKDVTLVFNSEAADEYKAAGVEVIKKNLSTGNSDAPELFLCYYR